jgi:ATP-binding cassette, subfamily B, bacterial
MQKINKKKYRSLQAYISFIGTFKYRFLIVFICFIISDVLLAVLPIFIGRLVGELTKSTISHYDVYFFVSILIAISIGHDVTWRLGDWTYRGLINGKSYEFENILFRAVMTRPYPYFVGKFTGKISSYVTTLGREFREFISAFCYEYADLLVKLPIIAGIMFTINIVTGVIFMVAIITMFFAGKYLVRFNITSERALTDATSNLEGYTIDVISNFVNVKAFRREIQEYDVIKEARKDVIYKSNHKFIWSIIFWTAMSFIVRWIIWPSTLLFNIALFLDGKLSIVQITTFISALAVFSDYIWSVVGSISRFYEKLARVEESYRYLYGDTNVIHKFSSESALATEKKEISFRKSLKFDELEFAYPDKPDRMVLKNISFTIQKNEKIGIVGMSGSGKTTLIKLMLGYYGIATDMVMLDNQKIDNRNLVELMTYVPQDTSLFHRTIAENISYGSDDKATREDIERAAKRAHAHEFIIQTDDKYDAIVGERGIKLSMGQRQRLAIARAFLSDKPILILDEATSALDSESEVLVQKSLEDLWHDKTVIAIAHRLSTLRHMDRIIVLDKGEIIEQGTHEELLKQKGKYYLLWQHQSNGMLVE